MRKPQTERNAEIKARYEAGVPIMRLAGDYQLLPTTIATYLGISTLPYMNPVQKRQVKEASRRRKGKGHPELKAEYTAGATVEELAAKYSLKPATVCRYLHISQLSYLDEATKERLRGNVRARRQVWKKELGWQYHKAGRSIPAIAREYGLSPLTVATYIGVCKYPYMDNEKRQRYREAAAAKMRRLRAKAKAKKMGASE
jgi:Mor family transcriptional regulator